MEPALPVAVRPLSRAGAARTLVIDELHSVKARLAIIPAEAGKGPKVWDIHDLRMTSVSLDARHAVRGHADQCRASRRNRDARVVRTVAKPGAWRDAARWRIHVRSRRSVGLQRHLGHPVEPRQRSAACWSASTSTGKPRRRSSRSRPAVIRFRCTPNITRSSTAPTATRILERIDASFLKTSIVAKGGVVGTPGKDGRTVTLDVTIDKGRLEDVLKLAVKADNAHDRRAAARRPRSCCRPATWMSSRNCASTAGSRSSTADSGISMCRARSTS